jgi:hypothetical protein
LLYRSFAAALQKIILSSRDGYLLAVKKVMDEWGDRECDVIMHTTNESCCAMAKEIVKQIGQCCA